LLLLDGGRIDALAVSIGAGIFFAGIVVGAVPRFDSAAETLRIAMRALAAL
jgi:hypothetical protein